MSSGIDKLLEERFRFILTQEKWIPPATPSETTSSVLSGGGGGIAQSLLKGGDETKRFVGYALVAAAAVGLVFIAYKYRRHS